MRAFHLTASECIAREFRYRGPYVGWMDGLPVKASIHPSSQGARFGTLGWMHQIGSGSGRRMRGHAVRSDWTARELIRMARSRGWEIRVAPGGKLILERRE